MSKTLTEIAKHLRSADKKVQLIYAFNGSGKTRLSREFKKLVSPKFVDDIENFDEVEDFDAIGQTRTKILYYNAFTEDLFYWDNDEITLKIQRNTFIDWIIGESGQDQNIVANFQRYSNDKIRPKFKEEDEIKEGKKTGKKTYPEVTFSLYAGTDRTGNIKISKGEESNFIWSVFYTLLDQAIAILNIADPSERDTDRYNQLEYVFIDDPVSSLDENHLIELAVNLAGLIKSSQSDLKFIVTTHNPLFYNVLHSELNSKTWALLSFEWVNSVNQWRQIHVLLGKKKA
jgi:wobble nucleotide-excising tRNase